MNISDIDRLYEEQILALPRALRLKLLARIAGDLADAEAGSDAKRSIMELHGLGAELWRGVDAARYVDELRDEWDRQRR